MLTRNDAMTLGTAIGVSLLCTMSAAAAPLGSRAPPLDYWVAPTTELLRPGTLPFGAARRVTVMAARGERESFFVVLPGADSSSGRVQVSATPFLGRNGTVAPDRVQAWRAAWVEAGGQRVPDALLPLDGSASEVVGIAPPKRGDDLVLYVELDVPPDATPGRYVGTVHVTASGGEALIPVLLTVFPVLLPKAQAVHTCALPECDGDAGRDRGLLETGEAARLGSPGYSVRSLGWTAWVRRAGGLAYAGAEGDALFYALRAPEPGRPPTFESVRLKLLTEGLEDYELLRQLDRAGKGVLARVLALRMTRHPEVMDFDAVRSEVFRMLTDSD